MAAHHHPLYIRQCRRLAAMRIGKLGRLFDVLDQIDPGGGETLVGLRASTTLNKSLDNAGSGDLLSPSIEDLLLQLSD